MPAVGSILLFMAAGLPGPGQIYGPPAPTPRASPHATVPGIGPDIHQIFKSIHDGRQEGQLSGKQARELRREARLIGELEERYAADGLTESEAAELRNRAEVVRAIANSKRMGTIK